jgi:hypothetical protein
MPTADGETRAGFAEQATQHATTASVLTSMGQHPCDVDAPKNGKFQWMRAAIARSARMPASASASSAARARQPSGATSRASANVSRCRPRRSRAVVEPARLRSGERAGEQAEALRGPRLDDREHEQPVEQPVRLGLADPLAERGGVIIAVVVARRLAAARHQLSDLDDVARLVVREPSHRGDEIGALGIAADQRQRGLRRLAFAVQVVGVDAVEVGERYREPPRIAGDERQRITERRDVEHHANDATVDREL